MQVSFPTTSLQLQVNDKAGNPLAEALVTVREPISGSALIGTTNANGVVTFNLIPWNYTLSVTSKGARVYDSGIDLKAYETVRITSNVFLVAVKAIDASGRPLNGADLTISSNGYNETVPLTNGSSSIQLPAGTQYDALVSSGGSQIYSGVISADNNGATIILSTSYLPPTLELYIAVAIVAALAVAVVLLFGWRLGLLRQFRINQGPTDNDG
jgi:hypothetical protein